MTGEKPTIVIVTTQAALGAVYERHLERFAKVVLLPEIAEFERNAIRLHAKALAVDLGNEDEDGSLVAHIQKLRKQPTMKQLHLAVFCRHASSKLVAALHGAGVNDIILTTHATPRSVAQRLHNLLLL